MKNILHGIAVSMALLTGCDGSKGKAGSTGEQGPQGEPGTIGPQGNPGAGMIWVDANGDPLPIVGEIAGNSLDGNFRWFEPNGVVWLFIPLDGGFLGEVVLLDLSGTQDGYFASVNCTGAVYIQPYRLPAARVAFRMNPAGTYHVLPDAGVTIADFGFESYLVNGVCQANSGALPLVAASAISALPAITPPTPTVALPIRPVAVGLP